MKHKLAPAISLLLAFWAFVPNRLFHAMDQRLHCDQDASRNHTCVEATDDDEHEGKKSSGNVTIEPLTGKLSFNGQLEAVVLR
jgi:hypothetical protein